MCPQSCVEVGQTYPETQGKRQIYLVLAYRKKVSPCPSEIKPEEREFVVDSGASMHMLSRKDLNSAVLETVRISKSQTTVVTANGEVQTDEEATVYARELDLFVTCRRYTDSSLTVKTLRRSPGSYQWADEYNATRRTACRSLSLV